jgi:hypothetical protein
VTLAWGLVALSLLGGCGEDAKREAKCKRIASTVCDHQLECEITDDVFACDEDFQDTYQCDPEASLDDLQQCIDAAKILDCPTSIPFVCFEVLCDPLLGCGDESTTTADTDTDTDPP